jgi:hypothetical protein
MKLRVKAQKAIQRKMLDEIKQKHTEILDMEDKHKQL